MTFALAAALVCVLALAGTLVWRAEADRRERSHLLHLLIARTPSEVSILDRAVATSAWKGEPPTPLRPASEWEAVGERPVGA